MDMEGVEVFFLMLSVLYCPIEKLLENPIQKLEVFCCVTGLKYFNRKLFWCSGAF